MTAHQAAQGSPIPVRSKAAGRPDGWFHACTCGWTGPARVRQSQCAIDQNQHERDSKESAA